MRSFRRSKSLPRPGCKEGPVLAPTIAQCFPASPAATRIIVSIPIGIAKDFRGRVRRSFQLLAFCFGPMDLTQGPEQSFARHARCGSDLSNDLSMTLDLDSLAFLDHIGDKPIGSTPVARGGPWSIQRKDAIAQSSSAITLRRTGSRSRWNSVNS